MTEGRLRTIEGHDDSVRPAILEQVHQHRREPEHCVGDLPTSGDHALGRECEKGSIGERVPVENEKRLAG